MPGNSAHKKIDWAKVREDYLKWATAEFVEGRKERAMAPSTAKQVLGSVMRMVQGVKEQGAHLFFVIPETEGNKERLAHDHS